MRTLRNYIALSKDYEPKISPKLTTLLVERYVKKRIFYSDLSKQGERYITTRNLLALIRLCQARVHHFLFRLVSDSPTIFLRRT
jgi:DNA replicative helicase MCM subunit Mcm2 (Cdc46/Mcm family)